MIALICAALSSVFPLVGGARLAIYVGFPLSVAWLFFLGYGLTKNPMHCWRSILGLPFALFWPYVAFALYHNCWFHECF